MLWFTKYVDDNAEELRTAFVMHAGKKKLTVRTHSADEREWNEFFDKVIEEIRKNTVKGVTEKLECNFSSTSRF
jgi:iron uptake system EfeUOB component EfeO/EfeM